jgi:hypothetical protein
MVDTDDSEPEKRTRKRRRRKRPALKFREFLYNLVEALWQMKQMERFHRKRLASGQGRHADKKGNETACAAYSLGNASWSIGDLSASIAMLLFKDNGFDLTGTRPWLAFGFAIGASPFRYHLAVEPGRVLVGERLITSYRAKDARVIVFPTRRHCRLVEIPSTPEPTTPPTQDNTHDG